MKQLKVVLGVVFLLLMIGCKSSVAKDDIGPKKEVELKIIDMKGQERHKVFYQEWIAGVQYGGSGVNLYILASTIGVDTAVVAYFRDQKKDLKQVSYDGQEFLIGRFKTAINQPKDFVMSNDPIQELGNADKLLDLAQGLDKNEAIVCYKKSGQLYQVTLKNIAEMEQLLYPSPPPPPNDE